MRSKVTKTTKPSSATAGRFAIGDHQLDYRALPAAASRLPGLFWLGGFMSDKDGSKALEAESWAEERGSACLRFDYAGHGTSSGNLEEETISSWLEQSRAIFDSLTDGPQIVAGSSMGGWLALLLAKHLETTGQSDRIACLVLLAPATDMTHDLIAARLKPADYERLAQDGRLVVPSSEDPYIFTRDLIEDGRKHLLLRDPLTVPCPVRIIQGMQDDAVPWTHTSKLVDALSANDVIVTYIKDADHRLSRPQDLNVLRRHLDLAALGSQENGG